MGNGAMTQQGLNHRQCQCGAPLLCIRQPGPRSRRPPRLNRGDPGTSVSWSHNLGSIGFISNEIEWWLVRLWRRRPGPTHAGRSALDEPMHGVAATWQCDGRWHVSLHGNDIELSKRLVLSVDRTRDTSLRLTSVTDAALAA
jgi:hypothetical protein